jgi:hypothetical protein
MDQNGTSVKIENATGCELVMDATQVKLKNASGCEITMDPTGITIDAGVGMLTLKGSVLQLSPTGAMTVQAPMATFSGVVQSQTVIATSVVGTTYTPGVGNLI